MSTLPTGASPLAFSAPGFWEWAFLAVLALLIFGPERLPGMARSAGEMISRFKREAAGTIDELKAAAELEEFSGVASDLRSTGEGLRRDFTLDASARSSRGTKPQSATLPSGADPGPAPFDPDTP